MSSLSKQQSYIFQLLLICCLFFACFYSIFQTNVFNNFSFSNDLWKKLFEQHLLIYQIISCGLIVINTFLIRYVLLNNALIGTKNFEPSIIYLFVVCIFPQTMQIESLFITLILLIFVINKILLIFGRDFQYANFSVGLFCGLISLCYFPLIFSLIFVFLSYLINRNLTWKNFIFPILGATLAYVYYFAFLYLFDFTDIITNFSFKNLIQVSLRDFSIYRQFPQKILIGIIYFLILLVSMIKMLFNLDKELIDKRKRCTAIFFSTIIALIISILFDDKHGLSFSLFLFMSSLQISLSLDLFKRKILLYIAFCCFFIINTFFMK